MNVAEFLRDLRQAVKAPVLKGTAKDGASADGGSAAELGDSALPAGRQSTRGGTLDPRLTDLDHGSEESEEDGRSENSGDSDVERKLDLDEVGRSTWSAGRVRGISGGISTFLRSWGENQRQGRRMKGTSLAEAVSFYTPMAILGNHEGQVGQSDAGDPHGGIRGAVRGPQLQRASAADYLAEQRRKLAAAPRAAPMARSSTAAGSSSLRDELKAKKQRLEIDGSASSALDEVDDLIAGIHGGVKLGLCAEVTGLQAMSVDELLSTTDQLLEGSLGQEQREGVAADLLGHVTGAATSSDSVPSEQNVSQKPQQQQQQEQVAEPAARPVNLASAPVAMQSVSASSGPSASMTDGRPKVKVSMFERAKQLSHSTTGRS